MTPGYTSEDIKRYKWWQMSMHSKMLDNDHYSWKRTIMKHNCSRVCVMIVWKLLLIFWGKKPLVYLSL